MQKQFRWGFNYPLICILSVLMEGAKLKILGGWSHFYFFLFITLLVHDGMGFNKVSKLLPEHSCLSWEGEHSDSKDSSHPSSDEKKLC